jgi:hypothetical protein
MSPFERTSSSLVDCVRHISICICRYFVPMYCFVDIFSYIPVERLHATSKLFIYELFILIQKCKHKHALIASGKGQVSPNHITSVICVWPFVIGPILTPIVTVVQTNGLSITQVTSSSLTHKGWMPSTTLGTSTVLVIRLHQKQGWSPIQSIHRV